MMAPFASAGAVIAVSLLAAMARGPVSVRLAPYHLSYGIRVPDGFLIVTIYVVAVCGPLLLSGCRSVAIFGIVNLVARRHHRPAHRFRVRLCVVRVGGLVQWCRHAALPLRQAPSSTRPVRG